MISKEGQPSVKAVLYLLIFDPGYKLKNKICKDPQERVIEIKPTQAQ